MVIGTPADSALWYPWQRASVTNSAIVDLISWNTWKKSSRMKRWSSNHHRPPVVRITWSDAAISARIVGGFVTSTEMIVCMRQYKFPIISLISVMLFMQPLW